MDPMIISVLYIWCQLNKDTIVNFWFGTQFKVSLIYNHFHHKLYYVSFLNKY